MNQPFVADTIVTVAAVVVPAVPEVPVVPEVPAVSAVSAVSAPRDSDSEEEGEGVAGDTGTADTKVDIGSSEEQELAPYYSAHAPVHLVKSVEFSVGGEVWERREWCEGCKALHAQDESCFMYQAFKEMFG